MILMDQLTRFGTLKTSTFFNDEFVRLSLEVDIKAAVTFKLIIVFYKRRSGAS